MQKTKSSIRNEIIVPSLAILAVLLALLGVFQPWWAVRTSPELQMVANSTMTVDADLFKVLNVVRTDANVTTTATFAMTNSTAYQDPIFRTITGNRTDAGVTSTFTFGLGTGFQQQAKQMANAMNLTLPLALVGLVLAVATTILIFLVIRKKMALERYTYAVGVLAAIVLLIAPLQLATGVNGFWASTSITSYNSVWQGQTVSISGAAVGWYLMLGAALMIIVCLLPVRIIYSDKKRGIQSLK
jgi:heme/copper-type cytochrome/quinol oxidase subunit 4